MLLEGKVTANRIASKLYESVLMRGELLLDTSKRKHVSDGPLPTRPLFQEMESKSILQGVSAIFKPATTTLILGPPGSGKVLHSSSTNL